MEATHLIESSSFERAVSSQAASLGALWSACQAQQARSSIALMPEEALKTSVRALLPRTLTEGLACQELGWAWADGAGVAEWEESFLAQLARDDQLPHFLQMLQTLRESAH